MINEQLQQAITGSRTAKSVLRERGGEEEAVDGGRM